jgi:hypothetical protein
MSVKPSENNSEWLTRKRLIDPKLKAAGWKIVPFSLGAPLSAYSGRAIEEFETANGPREWLLCSLLRSSSIIGKEVQIGYFATVPSPKKRSCGNWPYLGREVRAGQRAAVSHNTNEVVAEA